MYRCLLDIHISEILRAVLAPRLSPPVDTERGAHRRRRAPQAVMPMRSAAAFFFFEMVVKLAVSR
jgi:hypothetical protein